MLKLEPFDPRYDADITGLEYWEVLLALHRNTRAFNMGRIHDRALTAEDAKELIAGRMRPAPITMEDLKAAGAGVVESEGIHFDYVCGRPMKITFYEQSVRRIDLYDRNAKRPGRDVIAELKRARGGEGRGI